MSGDGVRVEPGQLEGKANDISTAPTDSAGFPSAPCAFTFVQTASAQVQAGAVTLKSFVASGNREASNLAIVLRTAAGVYRSVDERTREALDHDPPNALKLALALAPWWLVRGRWVQGYALLQRAAGQADQADSAWCAAQVWLGRLARGASDFISVVLGHNSAVVTALKDGPPSSGLADGLVGRAAALRNLGQLDEAAAAGSSPASSSCRRP